MNQSIKSLVASVIFVLTLVVGSSRSSAQDVQQLQADYDSKLSAWRETIKEMHVTGFRYTDAIDERSARKLRVHWESLRDTGRGQLNELIDSAVNLFTNMEDPPLDLVMFMSGLQGKILSDGNSLKAYEIGNLLLKALPEDENVQRTTARAAIRISKFDEAAKLAASVGTAFYQGLPPLDAAMFDNLPDLQAKYARELEFRTADAKADNLPQVRFETNHGEIVVELFVNQAPSTVANFLSLVEEKKYDGMTFNMVVKDMIALSGQLYRDGKFSPTPYRIVDECERDDARSHFFGTLSIARNDQPNSGYMHFYMCYLPMSQLDGRRTVFGRITSGFKAFEALSVTHVSNDDSTQTPLLDVRPDYIIKAEVIRKPEGEYKIKKTE